MCPILTTSHVKTVGFCVFVKKFSGIIAETFQGEARRYWRPRAMLSERKISSIVCQRQDAPFHHLKPKETFSLPWDLLVCEI